MRASRPRCFRCVRICCLAGRKSRRALTPTTDLAFHKLFSFTHRLVPRSSRGSRSPCALGRSRKTRQHRFASLMLQVVNSFGLKASPITCCISGKCFCVRVDVEAAPQARDLRRNGICRLARPVAWPAVALVAPCHLLPITHHHVARESMSLLA